jgi:hypothetical protein
MSLLKNAVLLTILANFVALCCMISSAQNIGPNYQCNFSVFRVKGSGPGFAPTLNSINRYDKGVGYMPVAPNGRHIQGFVRNPKRFNQDVQGTSIVEHMAVRNQRSRCHCGRYQVNAEGTEGRGFRITKGRVTLVDFTGASVTSAQGINNNGDIVGSYDVENEEHGFVLKDGAFHSIDVSGAALTDASGINDNGIIVGVYTTPNLAGHGFILFHGHKTTVDYSRAADTTLSAINNRGAIVGTFFQGSTVGGFVYQDGIFRRIVIPNSTKSSQITANGINEFGDISGSISVTLTDLEAYIGTGCH